MYFRGDRYREYGVYRQRILSDTLQVGYLHALGNVVLAHVRKPVVLVEPLFECVYRRVSKGIGAAYALLIGVFVDVEEQHDEEPYMCFCLDLAELGGPNPGRDRYVTVLIEYVSRGGCL